LIGGEPEEEQTYTAKQIRQAVNNGGAKFISINHINTNLSRQAATQFIHINPDSYDAVAMGLAKAFDSTLVTKMGVVQDEIDTLIRTLGETQGDLIIMIGSNLSAEAQAVLAAAAVNYASDVRRVLLHPLPMYNNSVGAYDLSAGRMSIDEVLQASKALLIGGSLQDASLLAGKEFIAVQELFETETTGYADVVFPAASFAEVDGTYTNNAGNVQRVRKAIDPVHQSRADWMITSLIAREMGTDFGYNFSASMVFKNIADAVAPYAGLRYPDLKDESSPVQIRHAINPNSDLDQNIASLAKRVEALPDTAEKINEIPRIGHKLHRLTTMTSCTPQFHLLANGNPKPENLLVSPFVQFNLDGTEREEGLAEAASVGLADRSVVGKH
jgi:NADH dehydrogenase/NADH:ubiquinone oxidoreductase subunit G